MTDTPKPKREITIQTVLMAGVAVIILLLIGQWFYSTFIQSEEDKVREVVRDACDALENHDAGSVTGCLSEDFRVGWGSSNYKVEKEDVHRALLRLLMVDYKGEIQTRIEPADFDVALSDDEKSATATFHIHVKGKRTKDSDWVEINTAEAGGRSVFKAQFKLTDDGWKMSRVAFERPD